MNNAMNTHVNFPPVCSTWPHPPPLGDLPRRYDGRTQSSTYRVHRPRIAVSEDDDATRLLVARVLEREGYQVVHTKTGAWLLSHVASCCIAKRPFHIEAVIADLWMPQFGGYHILRALDGLPNAPPVIVVTGDTRPATRAEALRIGAAAFIEKPFDVRVLAETIRNVVGSRGREYA